MRNIASRTAATSANLSSGGFGNPTDGNYRLAHKVFAATTEIRLVFTNFNWLFQNGSSDFTIRVGFEEADGTVHAVNFSGSRDRVMAPGDIVISDPITVDVAAGDTVYVRVRPTCASGETWPMNFQLAASDLGEHGVGTTSDKSTSGTVPDAAAFGYGPSALVSSTYDEDVPVLALLGDSVMTGQASTSPLGGFAERTMFGACPYIQMAASAGRATQISTNTVQIDALLPYCTHAICEYPVNDVGSGGTITLAQIKAALIVVWESCADAGVLCFQTTTTPQTTSTDSWATLVNQTVTAYESSHRTALNDWIRAGAPMSAGVAVAIGTPGALVAGDEGHPLAGYFEIADTVESSRNSGKWIVGTTDDGLHPSETGHALMAEAVDLTEFLEPYELDLTVPRTVKTADYTLTANDDEMAVDVNTTDDVTITVPNLSAGTVIEVARLGSGAVGIAPDSGVTIRSIGDAHEIANRYGIAVLRQRATNEWVATGDLA